MKFRDWGQAVLLLLITASIRPLVAADAPDPDRTGALKYRLIGPASGGRVSGVVGIPGDPSTYYAATAAGGVWKSVNGGSVWEPVFDEQPVSSIGSVAVAPSDPNVVYVGTGEANIRGNVGEGNGLYKSTDAGATWTQVWKQEGQIGALAVHPANPDVAFAAVLGSPFGAGSERGILRTSDGGKSWSKVLFVDRDTGASDVAFDPANPNIVFAGFWQVRRYPWGLTSGGPGSGLYVSRDAGEHWGRLEGEGLPEGIWGRVGVRVAPGDSRRVYALIEAEKGGLFRSDDGGKGWKLINASRGLRQRAWYYSTLTIDPRNADIVWFPQVSMLLTRDGGEQIRAVKGGGWDYHDLWIDPANPKRMISGSDAGVALSWDGGETWVRPPLPIAQFYHVTVDSRTPYRVLGALQDYGTRSGPSNSLHKGGILLSDWHSVGGGEAGHIAVDAADPDIVWAGEYLGFISRHDERTGRAPHVGIYPENGSGHGAGDLRYRFQWTAPILVSPHDPKRVYHAGNVLFQTDDGGQHWRAISPDLTRNDPKTLGWSGGPITGDNTGVEFYGTIFALAESPVEAGVIWAGSDDGRVHVTRDGGGAWSDVTPRDLPEWGTVACIEASRWDAGTAYLVVDAHRLDDESPYLWKTQDFGHGWTRLTRGLDPEVYLHAVREDARRRDMLYLGSERGVRVSRDGGSSWVPLQLNMPTVAVVDLAATTDDLVVATLGRSAWILDDLTPVREMTPAIAAAPAHLFAPRPAMRWHYAEAPHGYTDKKRDGVGSNPPEGAIVSYHLGAKPEGEITLEVLDAGGRLVRRLSSELEPPYTPPEHPDWDPDTELEPDLAVEPGPNRTSWNLRYEGAERIEQARFDTGDPGTGALAPPGDYTLRLSVAGVAYEQPLRILADPRSQASPGDIEAQTEFLLQVREQMSRIAHLVEGIRSVREQIEGHAKRLGPDSTAAPLIEQGQSILQQLTKIEGVLHNPQAEVEYDVLAGRDGGAQLYSRLGWLFNGARDHEGPPTQGMLDMASELARVLEEQGKAMRALLQGDLAGLNALAAQRGMVYVEAPQP